MKRLVALVALLVLLAPGPWASLAVAQPAEGQRKIVVFQEGFANEAARGVLESHGAVIERQLDHTPFTAFSVILPEAAAPALAQARGVVRVETDFVVHALAGPDGQDKGGKPGPGPAPQPDQVLPWGVNRIDADLAWGGATGSGVRVAIIDTGISKTHPDLAANLKGGANFVAQKGRIDPAAYSDDNGHGSHVAGIVAAANNSLGVIGVAPSASLYAVKVLDKRGSGLLSGVVDGIYWAINNKMQVINMSLGCNCDTTSFKNAVDDAYAAGLVVVAAAGNSGAADGSGDTVEYPAKYASVIAVAATDSADNRAWWSSSGPAVEISAPGVNIHSTWKDEGYNTISGTSMAAPHVAGVASLLVSSGVADASGNGLINDEVRQRLVGTADDLGAAGRDNLYGYGLVDAQESVTGVQSTQ